MRTNAALNDAEAAAIRMSEASARARPLSRRGRVASTFELIRNPGAVEDGGEGPANYRRLRRSKRRYCGRRAYQGTAQQA